MKIRVIAALSVAISVCAVGAAQARQDAAPTPPPADAAAAQLPDAPEAVAPTAEAAVPAGPAVAPAGTMIAVRVTQEMSSKTAKIGDHFNFVLHTDVIVNGQILIPAGTPGVGEVIDAAHGGMAGKGGKLVLAARYLEFNGQQVPVRTLRLSGGGEDRNGLVLGLSMAGGIYGSVAAMFIQGGEVVVPADTVATAKLTNAFPAGAAPMTTVAQPAAAAPVPAADAAPAAPAAPGA